MIGRLSKIRRRHPDAAPAGPEVEPGSAAPGSPGLPLPAGSPMHPDGPGTAGPEPATAVLPAVQDPGAGVDPAAAVPVSPSFRDRGKLRRRLRYLRRVRELGYRDLGGLTFDLHRFRRDGTPLVQEKLAALGAVDAELRAVERALGDERAFVDLREAGIAACPRCAALHGSEARFCPSCGIALVGPMAGAVAAPPAGTVGPAGGPQSHTPLWGPPPAAGQPAAPAGAPAAAVFPGPVAPVPAEQPTQIIPAGADAPPSDVPATRTPEAPPASTGPAAPLPAPQDPARGLSDGPSRTDGGSSEPATVAGGSVAEPDRRAGG